MPQSSSGWVNHLPLPSKWPTTKQQPRLWTIGCGGQVARRDAYRPVLCRNAAPSDTRRQFYARRSGPLEGYGWANYVMGGLCVLNSVRLGSTFGAGADVLPNREPQQRPPPRIGSVRPIRGQGTRKPLGQNGVRFTEEYAPANANFSKASRAHCISDHRFFAECNGRRALLRRKPLKNHFTSAARLQLKVSLRAA